MGVKFEDYYETLGVKRDASKDEIQSAYRALTRKYHPDLHKDDPDAEAKYRKINEAYEVLRDEDKRRKYDQLGSNWQHGQDFRPPPGYENVHFDFGGGAGGGAGGRGGGFSPGGFSEFFEAFFGGSPQGFGGGSRGGRGSQTRSSGGARGGSRSGRQRRSSQPRDSRPAEAELPLTLEEVYRGGTRHVEVQYQEPNRQGLLDTETIKLDVKIPPGTTDGTRIRIKGEGPIVGHTRSDLMLRVKIKPHPRFTQQGTDLSTTLSLSPWVAALGGKVSLQTMDGAVTLTVPPGAQHGQKLRLRNKGLLKRSSDGSEPGGQERGDLFATIHIAIPKTLTDEQRELMEKLRDSEANG